MTDNAKKFLTQVSQNTELAEKLRNASADQVMILAKELGYDLTEEDFAKHEGEVSEDELDAVAGGKICSFPSAWRAILQAASRITPPLPAR